jgi:hypothetical protein
MLQSTIWFANNSELDLFHAVVSDLQAGRHPGNRISVPMIRQATIMKRNRAGFYTIRHAVRRPPTRASLDFQCVHSAQSIVFTVCSVHCSLIASN